MKIGTSQLHMVKSQISLLPADQNKVTNTNTPAARLQCASRGESASRMKLQEAAFLPDLRSLCGLLGLPSLPRAAVARTASRK